MLIGFVFTNYNNSELTKATVSSIIVPPQHQAIIIIVDNNSSTEQQTILKNLAQERTNVTILFQQENIGYFPGLNIGILYLKKKSPTCKLMVIGNNDLVFTKNFFSLIEKHVQLFEKYPVIAPNIIGADGIPQNPHVIGEISRLRELIYHIYYAHFLFAKIIVKLVKWTNLITRRSDYKHSKKAIEINQGYGACYVFGPLFFKHFAQLYAPGFLFFEEFFLWYQLAEKNFKIYYEPSIVITHLAHSTTGKLARKQMWLYSKESYKKYRKILKNRKHNETISNLQ